MPHSAERSAPAKINLALAVGPPRPSDGYHPICSWFAPISLADTLRFERAPDGSASSFDIRWAGDAPRPAPIDWPIEKDLAARAHALLEQRCGRPLPVRATILKRTPIGGGLGGGSSDAAATLLALRDLFAIDLDADSLRALAHTLGADVPFFIPDDGRPLTPALVEGVGERIERTPPIEGAGAVLLIFPPFGCATGEVYRAFDAADPPPLDPGPVRAMARAARIDPAALANDLAAPAERAAPPLALIRAAAARASGRPVHITGSGSTSFIILGPREETAPAVAALESALPGCAVLAARFL